jgi:hypothetical protein
MTVSLGRFGARKGMPMSDRNWLKERELERRRHEFVTSHYAAAIVLLAAAAGFLMLVFALDRALDFERFTH